MRYFVGIDSGSTMCKAVLFDAAQNAVCSSIITKTGWNPATSAAAVLDDLLARHNISLTDVHICTTGYGREAIKQANSSFTEITCHTKGALHLSPTIGGVIDIGGQDSKVIELADGRVNNFLMNDKCAAGTGRFLTMACDTLGVEIADIDDFVHPITAVAINSMCTVFAESEIISSLAAEKERSQILRGVLESIAHKITQMMSKMSFDPTKPLLMTGGLARSQTLVDIIATMSGFTITTHPQAQLAGALGVCLCVISKQREL